jgi:hypothetical protein
MENMYTSENTESKSLDKISPKIEEGIGEKFKESIALVAQDSEKIRTVAEQYHSYCKELESYGVDKKDLAFSTLNIFDAREVSPQECRAKREAFSSMKDKLISQWEEKHDCSWPRYTEDVYYTTKSGDTIMLYQAGDRYEVHHILPLSLGGENKVENITPMRADDHKAVHSSEGALKNLEHTIKGVAQ